MPNFEDQLKKSVDLINKSHHITAFTGAGISVESGIPSFRGKNGLWNKYDPIFLDLNYFYKHPLESWRLNKEIFYDFFGKAKPNLAHQVLAQMEKKGFIQAIITQNIDNLHQKAGSKIVYEFHGSSRTLSCINCGQRYDYYQKLLAKLPPRCEQCGGILKPDYIFFGEQIPEPARSLAFKEAELADLFIIIGTTGEIQPACLIPIIAKEKGAKIIEINTRRSNFTDKITDIFLKGNAAEIMGKLFNYLV